MTGATHLLAVCCAVGVLVSTSAFRLQQRAATDLTSEPVTTILTSGDWPGAASEEGDVPVIPETTVTLTLEGVTFNTDDMLSLKPLPSLTTIVLNNIISKKEDGTTSEPFPLQKFTAESDRSKIAKLTFNHVDLSIIVDDFFEGFTGLKELFLINSGIKMIDPNVFKELSTGPTSLLNTLAIQGDTELTSFAWDLLAPVANSLTVSNCLIVLYMSSCVLYRLDRPFYVLPA